MPARYPSDTAVQAEQTRAQTEQAYVEQAKNLQHRYEAIFSDLYVDTPAVVSIRMDGGNAIDYSTIAPMFEARGLAGSFALNARRMENEAEYPAAGKMTFAQAYDLQSRGFELSNHSHSEANPDPTAGGLGLNNLAGSAATGGGLLYETDNNQFLIPHNLNVDRFVQPGSWTNAYNFTTADLMDNSEAGRIIKSRFAAMDAYVADDWVNQIRNFPVTRRFGGSHRTATDATSAATLTGDIDHAIQGSAYIQFLVHAVQLDNPGNLTTAQLTTFLDYVAAKRDAGLLTVLTPTGADFAKRGTPTNLVGDPSFVKGAAAGNYWDWLVTGAPTINAAGTAQSGGSNRSITIDSGNYITKNFVAGKLRSLYIEFWARSSTTSASTARLLLKQTIPDGSQPINRDIQIPINANTGAWVKVRAFVRTDPRGGTLVVRPYAVGTTNKPMYSDFVMRKV